LILLKPAVFGWARIDLGQHQPKSNIKKDDFTNRRILMNVSLDDLAAINSLNLDAIKLKLMHVESGEGWDRARAEAAESEYRRFLYLTRKYPGERIAPTVEADTFWHYHILDTVKYAKDCEDIFGHFLHHDPNVGIGEGSSPDEQIRASERMWALYESEFGTVDLESRASAWCTVTDTAGASPFTTMKAVTAWCTVTAPRSKTAWCTVTAPRSKTAWCTVTGTRAKTAWCTLAIPKAKNAWCTVTVEASGAAAHMAAAGKATTAWCTVTAADQGKRLCRATAEAA
jgi:hypothetical protein